MTTDDQWGPPPPELAEAVARFLASHVRAVRERRAAAAAELPPAMVEAAKECVRRTRAAQGLPPTIENQVALDRIAAAFGDPAPGRGEGAA